MQKRFRDAIYAQAASNPVALCHTLAKLGSQFVQDGLGTEAFKRDPACRLIAYQIGFLMNTPGFDMRTETYDAAMKTCRSEENWQHLGQPVKEVDIINS